MIEKRVYYKDTDAGGVVYYANYLGFLEEARTEFLRERGIALEEYAQRGILFIVTEINVRYQSPAFYGDVLLIDTKVPIVKNVSIIFEHQILSKADGRKILEAEIKMGCLSKEGKPERISQEMKEAIKK